MFAIKNFTDGSNGNVMRQIAKRFNKSTGFVVGLVLLPVVFVSILGFGSDKPTEA